MQKITQAEFDALPVIGGYRQCPGFRDYSGIKNFGEGCSFGQGCRFGEWCSFGERCSFGQRCSFGEAEFLNPRIIMLTSVGDSGSIVIWRGADGIDRFQIGCRFDTEENCLAAIAKKYGSESLYHGAIHLLKRIADKECSGNHL